MAEMLTIPRAEHEALKDALNLAKGQIAHLNDQLEQLRRMLFGQSSERFVDAPGNQPELDGLAEAFTLLEEEAPAQKPTPIPSHERTCSGKGKSTLTIPDELPREEVILDVPEAERTMADGTKLVKIGEDRDEKLAYRPGGYFVKVTIRPRYAHASEPSLGVVQEPAANGVFKGAKVDESLAAHLAADKYGLHLPLYRQIERLASEAGVKMTRQHASAIILKTGAALEDLFAEAVKVVLAGGVVHVDETEVKMLDPGAGKTKSCRAWTYAAGGSDPPPYVVFDFTQGRDQRFLFDVLADYKGVVQADAYVAYENLESVLPEVAWAACWAHARRKFEACLKGASAELARWVMQQMRYLFLFERIAWTRTPAERLRIRNEYERPIVDALFQRLKRELVEAPFITPKSKIATAIGYLLKRPEAFRRYLDDPELAMDNNLAERQMRKVALGRKNWLFVGSHKAGRAMAILLTFSQICRNLGISCTEWLTDVLRVLPDWPKDRLPELLPDRWLANRQQA